MARPDLTDPAARDAYLAGVQHAGQAPRNAGLALAVSGLVLAVVHAFWVPSLPAIVPMVVITLALGLLLIGIVRRVRWHLSRRRG